MQLCAGGQKVKVVLAAAMWNCPHLLVLVRFHTPHQQHAPPCCKLQQVFLLQVRTPCYCSTLQGGR